MRGYQGTEYYEYNIKASLYEAFSYLFIFECQKRSHNYGKGCSKFTKKIVAKLF